MAAVEKLRDSHESRRKKRGALASEMAWRLTVIAPGVRVLSKRKQYKMPRLQGDAAVIFLKGLPGLPAARDDWLVLMPQTRHPRERAPSGWS